VVNHGDYDGYSRRSFVRARALVNRPRLLLLDEPLSALDANLRRQMQVELKSLQRELGITFLFVTHDQDEAMALSDRIVLLRAGRLEQVASPQEIYITPATAYTAQFIGQTNLLRCKTHEGKIAWGALSWKPSRQEAAYSLRPEKIRLSNACVNGLSFRSKIVRQTFEGATDLLDIHGPDGMPIRVRIPSQGPLDGEQNFEFSPADAVPVRDSAEA